MELGLLDKIKRLVIIALVTDDLLMETLVLKGGNALSIAYGVGNRGSADLDFSMEQDFADLQRTVATIAANLAATFAAHGLHAFDVKVVEKPKELSPALRTFWGGYRLEFKVADAAILARYGHDAERLRKASLEMGTAEFRSKTFSVDISRYEYCGHKVAHELEGFTYYVYPPQLLVFEKVRALCQQLPAYAAIVPTHKPRARARDFYDIHSLLEEFNVELASEESRQVLRQVFEAKKVPPAFLRELAGTQAYHEVDFPAVRSTVTTPEATRPFAFYFDYVVTRVAHLLD